MEYCRLPRQQCRGLIEADGVTDDAGRDRKRLPRQQCRGLIEATAGADGTVHLSRAFRGSNAAASLKS